jgi:hypothetical protein
MYDAEISRSRAIYRLTLLTHLDDSMRELDRFDLERESEYLEPTGLVHPVSHMVHLVVQ